MVTFLHWLRGRQNFVSLNLSFALSIVTILLKYQGGAVCETWEAPYMDELVFLFH